MTALHWALTGVEVDALRLPLKKKLSTLTDLPAHIVTFRGHLARLTTAGQAPLALDAYRLLLASLSSVPVFHQYTLLWTVANGAIEQQTFERYATYMLQFIYFLPDSSLSLTLFGVSGLSSLTPLANFRCPAVFLPLSHRLQERSS